MNKKLALLEVIDDLRKIEKNAELIKKNIYNPDHILCHVNNILGRAEIAEKTIQIILNTAPTN